MAVGVCWALASMCFCPVVCVYGFLCCQCVGGKCFSMDNSSACLSVCVCRRQYSAVVHDLYQGLQCASCGIRFLMEETEQYRLHLDWHFRLNRREKEASKMSCFRKWYYELKVGLSASCWPITVSCGHRTWVVPLSPVMLYAGVA